jgi:hypothetical protein
MKEPVLDPKFGEEGKVTLGRLHENIPGVLCLDVNFAVTGTAVRVKL